MTAPTLTLDGFHPEFAAFAETMAADRARAYPAKVKAGEFTQAHAAHRIFVMRAIAEIWRCAADNLTPQPLYHRLTRQEALDTLDTALELAERRARRAPGNAAYQHHVDQLRAMRWWHSRFGEKAYVLNMAFMLRHDALCRAADAQPERSAA